MEQVKGKKFLATVKSIPMTYLSSVTI